MAEGKNPVLILKERSTRQATWMRTDTTNVSELEQTIGAFVLSALRRFRTKCFEAGTQPDITMHAIMISDEDMDKLELDTWRSEMEEICTDVEHGGTQN